MQSMLALRCCCMHASSFPFYFRPLRMFKTRRRGIAPFLHRRMCFFTSLFAHSFGAHIAERYLWLPLSAVSHLSLTRNLGIPRTGFFCRGVTFTFKTTNTKYVHRSIAVEPFPSTRRKSDKKKEDEREREREETEKQEEEEEEKEKGFTLDDDIFCSKNFKGGKRRWFYLCEERESASLCYA